MSKYPPSSSLVEISHETYLPAFRRTPQKNPRLQSSHENRRWSRSNQRSPRQGSCAHSRLGLRAGATLAGSSLIMPTLTSEPISADGGRRGAQMRFCRQHRLIKHQVERLLRDGARFSSAELALRLNDNAFGQGRIAIAVPKRILKLAVDRNFVKRVIREQFRQSGFRALSVDMLVTLRSQSAKRGAAHNRRSGGNRLRETFTQLLGDVSRRFGATA